MTDLSASTQAEVSDTHALRAEVERLTAELAEMRAYADKLESLAHEDALTGVTNRRGFMRDLTRALAYAKRYGTGVALLLADLDGFKQINDTHGHEAGDCVLVQVADALKRNVRSSDAVGRIGGDEFALILWHIDEEAARLKAEALSTLVTNACTPGEGTTRVINAAIGATLLRPEDTAEEALARADKAMYARKAERRQSIRR